ncbi:MAG: IclR family transcriptional regulator [Gemmatimonadales bacterium]|nr:IclR family transcriptional regulator [Gemmatimonadales bacterium]
MLEKVNAILALFSTERPELSVIEIAERLRRPRSSVYRIVARAAKAGFLDQDPVTARYRVGIHLAALGELARHSTSLQRVAYPHLLALAEASGGETVVLMVPSGAEGVTIDLVEGFHPVRIPHHLGGRFPLHATAGGKLFLAAMPDAEVTRILRRPLVRATRKTITEPAKLRKELDLTRRRDYGVAIGEWVDDLCAVAAPVRDYRARVVAAIGVACPSPRWSPKVQRALVTACVHAAGETSRALGYR